MPVDLRLGPRRTGSCAQWRRRRDCGLPGVHVETVHERPFDPSAVGPPARGNVDACVSFAYTDERGTVCVDLGWLLYADPQQPVVQRQGLFGLCVGAGVTLGIDTNFLIELAKHIDVVLSASELVLMTARRSGL